MLSSFVLLIAMFCVSAFVCFRLFFVLFCVWLFVSLIFLFLLQFVSFLYHFCMSPFELAFCFVSILFSHISRFVLTF